MKVKFVLGGSDSAVGTGMLWNGSLDGALRNEKENFFM